MLAYFDLARGEVLRPLGLLHDEFFRIGPWIAAAPRRPAGLAILASWTTRTAGTPDVRRLHQTCLSSLHRSLALGFEDVDFLLEEQLARPPAELRAIIVSEAPLLTPETIANLNRFVVDGGILLLGSRVGISSPTGERYDDPWKQARSTGRVHDLDTGWHCQVGPDELSADLAKYDLEPESRTLEAGTEARFRGDSEILYWFLLNHDEEPATVSSIAHLDAQQFFWKDLLTGKPVVIGTGSPARYRTRVESSEAAVLIGVKRPAASMAVKANVTPTHVEIDAALFDSGGAPVADGYPARLTVNDESGASLILPKAQSRVARSGRIRWSVAIPVTSASGKLFFQVDEPISSMSRSGEVALSSPKSTISTEAVE